jgi:hypothetical protein
MTEVSKTLILPIALCSCKIWALPIGQKHKVQPFENNVRSEVLTVTNIMVKHLNIPNSVMYEKTVNLI